jgi:hypothetical protein
MTIGKKLTVTGLPHELVARGVQDSALAGRIIRASQGNFDHIMGLIRDLVAVVNQHADVLNALGDGVEILGGSGGGGDAAVGDGTPGVIDTKKGAYIWTSRSIPFVGSGARWYADRDGSMTSIFAWSLKDAVTTTAWFDLTVNGSSVCPTKPQIPTGALVGAEVAPSPTDFHKGDLFVPSITATGRPANTVGRLGLVVLFTYQ